MKRGGNEKKWPGKKCIVVSWAGFRWVYNLRGLKVLEQDCFLHYRFIGENRTLKTVFKLCDIFEFSYLYNGSLIFVTSLIHKFGKL